MQTLHLIYVSVYPGEDAFGLQPIDCIFLETSLSYRSFGVLPVEGFMVGPSFLAHLQQFIDVPSKPIPA